MVDHQIKEIGEIREKHAKGRETAPNKYVDKYVKDSDKCMMEVDKSVRELVGDYFKKSRKRKSGDGETSNSKKKKKSKNCGIFDGHKAFLVDPHGVLDNWDGDAVDPYSWTMVTYSAESLGTPSQKLSSILSPSIDNLTNLQIILLQNNNITGPIPVELGRLRKLHTLDLSDNHFTREILYSLSHLKSLQYIRLNNNTLSKVIPGSLANMTRLSVVDLSFNNLSAPVPRFPSKKFNILGNPLICATGNEPECYGTTLMPMSMPLNQT